MVVNISSTPTGILDGDAGFDLFYATTGGIGNADITARGGQNVVIGNNSQPFSTGIGISNSSISSTGSLTVIANGTTTGIALTSIFGGDGVDNITARGNLFGVLLAGIDGGGGDDNFDLQSGTGSVDGGSGIDTLILEGDISDYTFTEGSGFNSPDNISGADGTDLDIENIERFVLGGVQYTFDDLFGSGGQNISQAQLTGPFTGTDQDDSYEATSQGIINASFNTLAGNDTIIGNSANIANGIAISDTTISTGDDADTITATATGSNSIGLNNVTIQLGMGNDLVTAQGTFLGVQDVSIDGGGGNDQFQLKNGTGQVIGGDGNDTLNLFGRSTDYTFTDGDGSNLSGKITGANGTDLTVDGIESFQFSEGVFTFDELFNQPVSITQAQLTGNFDGTNKGDFYLATLSGIVDASFNTKEGSDTISAFNFNNGGTGISNTSISSGDGGDTIVAMAMGANSIGMDCVTIQAGTGNDVITAQGTLLGVQGVLINGGEGSDTFDIGSGTGIIVGGLPRSPEIDLLILDGQSLDYTFSGIIDLDLGRIINDDLGTNLTVFNVDLFEFDDGTFAFDELFGETPPPTPDPVEVSIAAIEQAEGDSGTTEFVFTVTRSGDDSEAVTVDWDIELIAGQANASDFVFGQSANGDVTIAAGQTSAEVVIEVQGDTDVEADEDFRVRLSNPSVGTIDQATAIGTILNDDQQNVDVEVSITGLTQDERDSGAVAFTFDVSRSRRSDDSVAVTLDWEIELIPGQADANDFFSAQQTTGQVTIGAGQDSAGLQILVQGDTDFEADEDFRVRLSNPSVGTIDQATAIGTILNDDDEPTPPDQGEVISRRTISGETVEGTDLNDFYEATQGGITNSTFETLGGNDSITSLSENGSAITFTQINTSDGDDTVSAETTVGNSPAINFSEINTGANDDTVIAKNTSDSSSATAIDDQVVIDTGDGNDTIIAEAENFPIRFATIKTGSGNDTIELRGGNDGLDNGFGTIDGGSGDQDLLILGATSARYLFELEDSTELKGNISAGDRGNTDLDLTGVEFFQFAEEPGTTYAFDELFTGEVFGVGGFVWDDLNGNGLQDSGEPGISGVQVALQNTFTGETLETTTDNDGLYIFENPDPNQYYQVAFSGPEGFEATEFRVNLGANPDIDSDVIPVPFAEGVQASPQFLFDGGLLFEVDAGYVAVA